jgi:hypothetical protein
MEIFPVIILNSVTIITRSCDKIYLKSNNGMWLFRKKKLKPIEKAGNLKCVYCGSADIKIMPDTLSDLSTSTKVWRGQRYTICKCNSCNLVFYTDELPGEHLEKSIVEDDDILRIAEEELKRETDAGGDRRYGM